MAAPARLSVEGVNNFFSDHFGISRLLETWINPALWSHFIVFFLVIYFRLGQENAETVTKCGFRTFYPCGGEKTMTAF